MWYQAIVERTGKSVRLSVRAEKEAGAEEIISKDAVLPGTFSILNLDQELTKLYVGGYPSTARIQPVVRFASFQGQVEEVNVGDVEVGLWNFVDAENIYGAVERDKLKILQQSTGFRFDGEGYAILDRRPYRFHDRIDVQLQFKTNADNGLLFLAGKEQEFMSVELSKGQISYKFNLGDGATVVMSSPQTYNDGQWHTIEAVRNRRDGILKVMSRKSSKKEKRLKHKFIFNCFRWTDKKWLKGRAKELTVTWRLRSSCTSVAIQASTHSPK